jgi:hypothetical protein
MQDISLGRPAEGLVYLAPAIVTGAMRRPRRVARFKIASLVVALLRVAIFPVAVAVSIAVFVISVTLIAMTVTISGVPGAG